MSPVKSAATVVVAALLTVLAADVVLQRVAPLPPRQTELEDGLAELERDRSDVLVFGSSHTRSFHVLADALAERSGRHRMAIVTMESGWGSSYDWVRTHRLDPILDHNAARTGPDHTPLDHVILVLTFSDVCGGSDHTNIPRNAWRLGDFVGDVLDHGITEFNRAYLTTKMNKLFSWSILAQRGGNVIERLKKAVRSSAQNAEAHERDIMAIRDVHFLSLLQRCPEPDDVAGLDRVIADFTARHVDLTVIMFPLVPSVMTAETDDLLARYRGIVAELTRGSGARVLDWTRLPTVEDGDFQEDFDHLTPAGAKKVMGWALDHDLSFLLARPTAHASAEPAP